MNKKPSKLSIIAGKNLVLIRKKLHLTQEKCAEIIGITVPHLSNFENGKCNVSLKVIEQIIEALPITPNDLLIEKTPQKKHNELEDIITRHMESLSFGLYLDLTEAFRNKNISFSDFRDYKIPPKKREAKAKVADNISDKKKK